MTIPILVVVKQQFLVTARQNNQVLALQIQTDYHGVGVQYHLEGVEEKYCIPSDADDDDW